MITQKSRRRLLFTGAISRLSVAALLAGLLWAGFMWATTTPGAL